MAGIKTNLNDCRETILASLTQALKKFSSLILSKYNSSAVEII